MTYTPYSPFGISLHHRLILSVAVFSTSVIFTARSRRTAAVEASDKVAARSTVLARSAGALIDLALTELTRVPGHTLTRVVAVAVDTRAVVTVHRGTAVNHMLAPVSIVACTASSSSSSSSSSQELKTWLFSQH